MEDRIIVDCIVKDKKPNLFSLVVKNYGGAVYSKAMGIVKDDERAKEATQQTFIRAYQRLSDWHGTSLGPWLLTIVSHVALNLLAKEQRYTQVDVARLELTDEGYSEAREQQLSRMEQAISKLSDQDRQIIQLHYYQKKKTDEVAVLTGLSHANVLVRLHRIRERLKKQLSQDDDE